MPIIIAIVIVLLLVFTWPLWVGLIVIFWPQLLAALLVFVVGVPVAVLWKSGGEAWYNDKVLRPVDAAWADWWRSLGRVLRSRTRRER